MLWEKGRSCRAYVGRIGWHICWSLCETRHIEKERPFMSEVWVTSLVHISCRSVLPDITLERKYELQKTACTVSNHSKSEYSTTTNYVKEIERIWVVIHVIWTTSNCRKKVTWDPIVSTLWRNSYQTYGQHWHFDSDLLTNCTYIVLDLKKRRILWDFLPIHEKNQFLIQKFITR